jgi:hypothetical protein
MNLDDNGIEDLYSQLIENPEGDIATGFALLAIAFLESRFFKDKNNPCDMSFIKASYDDFLRQNESIPKFEEFVMKNEGRITHLDDQIQQIKKPTFVDLVNRKALKSTNTALLKAKKIEYETEYNKLIALHLKDKIYEIFNDFFTFGYFSKLLFLNDTIHGLEKQINDVEEEVKKDIKEEGKIKFARCFKWFQVAYKKHLAECKKEEESKIQLNELAGGTDGGIIQNSKTSTSTTLAQSKNTNQLPYRS